ncbi:MAG: hypothetical protein EHM57_07940 [Actinobacteria bacterium]|nr:MAG: hypothetical protein EHM57_07940 [Actinomycetota bacterium]
MAPGRRPGPRTPRCASSPISSGVDVRARLSDRFAEERGAALLLVTLLLAVLIGMAAFMVDYGWLYWQGIETQHGADAAALAGVIYEPDDQTSAYGAAYEVAGQNGYVHGGNATVTPVDWRDDPTLDLVENTHQLYVRVQRDVPTYFMQFFGIDSVTITKHAVAEYVLPLPLGSPDSNFGNDPETGHTPNFWGNIHGYYTGRSMGDRYSSQCLSGGSGPSCTPNPDARPTNYAVGLEEQATGGYLYGIDVTNSNGLTVEIFDGAFTRGGNDYSLMGDQPQGSSPGPTTVFMIFSPDPTPLDTADGNVHLCTLTFAPQNSWWSAYGTANAANDLNNIMWSYIPPAVIADQWDAFPCTLDAGPGIYPVRVLTLNNGERGLNRWSMRASSSGSTQPRIYGLGDMAIYSNVDGALGNTIFYLAEVEEIHKNKELVIDLWDPGDASGNHSIRIVDPHGDYPPCTWTSTNPSYPSGSSSQCQIPTSSARFNNHGLQIRIELPDDYSCAGDCWWKIDYDYPGLTNDTTTWEARIEGNPVKLVE